MGQRITANRDFYGTPQALAFYGAYQQIQPGERAIGDWLVPGLAGMDMLDLGVGAGRTTAFFAPKVKSYVGMDYSPAMVAVSRQRFPGLRFEVGDASMLPEVGEGSVDFILFSFNGLDCTDLERRSAALRRFRACLRPGGFLAFSAHNLNFLPGTALASPAPRRDPQALLERFAAYLRFRRRVRSVQYDAASETARAVESQLGHQVEIVYVRPEWQQVQLRLAGLTPVAIFGGDNAEKLQPGSSAAANAADPWLYYLCQKQPHMS